LQAPYAKGGLRGCDEETQPFLFLCFGVFSFVFPVLSSLLSLSSVLGWHLCFHWLISRAEKMVARLCLPFAFIILFEFSVDSFDFVVVSYVSVFAYIPIPIGLCFVTTIINWLYS